jgi:hypothetical protein
MARLFENYSRRNCYGKASWRTEVGVTGMARLFFGTIAGGTAMVKLPGELKYSRCIQYGTAF